MEGQHSASVWAVGRPKKQIPSSLKKTLEDTYRQNTDFVVYGDPESEEVRELLRFGRLYAERTNLSFRHLVRDRKPDGTAEIRFRITRKRAYRKRNLQYWGVQ
jgi:hypothetical protein